MKPSAKWGAVALGVVVSVLALMLVIVFLISEALIVRRYTLPSSILQSSSKPEDLAWGRHVATVFGCRDCHSFDLHGKLLYAQPGLIVAAPDLHGFSVRYTDADFDRAVRRGLAPDARALWVMPSQAYAYMRDTDLADIIGYARSLSGDPHNYPLPAFDFRARLEVLAGTLAAVDPYDLGRFPPINAGPRYDGGRYLAAMACSSCHATDLTGTDTAPDLKVVGRYSRTQFFALMLRGTAPFGRQPEIMARLAQTRFHALKDYETDALYAYLVERAKTVNLNAAH